jgi:hypothetical protein
VTATAADSGEVRRHTLTAGDSSTSLSLPREAVLRANPAYELLPLERLPAAQRAPHGEPAADRDVYGVLRADPRCGLPTTLVSPETALLLLTLREPGPVPAYVAAEHGDRAGTVLARLVLDHLLEIQVDRRFVSGASAHAALHTGDRKDPAHPLGSLSIEAIRYAEAITTGGVPELAARIYCYHREPVSPQWLRRLPTPPDLDRYLGIEGNDRLASQLARHWRPVASGDHGWRHWRSRFWDDHRATSGLRYKLYFSPTAEALPAALESFVEAMTDVRAPTFKVGGNLPGLLRPDKVVAYFASYDELAAAAARLGPRHPEWPVHGVPFTGVIDPVGLVSWGLDPPSAPPGAAQTGQLSLSPYPGEASWRLWVAFRLATALRSAQRTEAPGVPPWRFALDRLELEGVDTTTWTPAGDAWQV